MVWVKIDLWTIKENRYFYYMKNHNLRKTASEAKNKVKVMETIKKTLTIFKSIPPKMLQGSWTRLWSFNFVVNIILVFLLLINKKIKEDIEIFLYQAKRK